MAPTRFAGAGTALALCALVVPGLASPDVPEPRRDGRPEPSVSEQPLLPALMAAALAVAAALCVVAARQWGARARSLAVTGGSSVRGGGEAQHA